MTRPGFLPTRQLVLVDLLGLLLSVRPGERVIVAVDGVDGAGKTHLVGELLALAPHVAGRELLAVSVDGFHRPRAERYARGRTADSYYEDSFDYDALRRAVLRPFRAGREIRPGVHDVDTDTHVHPDPVEAGDDAVLLVEGVFLRRPELLAEWDATLLVHVPLEVAVPRGRSRFPATRVPGDEDPDHPVNDRYVGGQRRYLQRARLAPPTWIVDNTDLQRPELLEPDPEDPQWFGA